MESVKRKIRTMREKQDAVQTEFSDLKKLECQRFSEKMNLSMSKMMSV